MEPKALPVLLDLTPEAMEYANGSVIEGKTIVVTGKGYPQGHKSFRLSAQAPLGGKMVKDYEDFELDDEGMKKLEKEIKTFGDIYKKFSPGLK